MFPSHDRPKGGIVKSGYGGPATVSGYVYPVVYVRNTLSSELDVTITEHVFTNPRGGEAEIDDDYAPKGVPDALGPEQYSTSVPINVGQYAGSDGAYADQRVTNSGTGTDGGYPRIQFGVGIVSGKQYVIEVKLNGANPGDAAFRAATSGGTAYLTKINDNHFYGVVTSESTVLELIVVSQSRSIGG